ncbi:hypothetical protein [Peribacillus kribbensis]|uniref:hypothetical protein n=1 Tax=Peribacillus kribbensis TaxID=356658 RepID=UPI0004035C49|nr:hypothetical protein [Peribacillus kribbensis]
MTLEKQLVEKAFYNSFYQNNNDETVHPIAILGEALMAGQADESADLASIRFAQGEVYFKNKDFESAVFKWELVDNPLKFWARKNIGDAYYAQGYFSKAEEMYKTIETEDMTLKAEVALQLFSLYIREENISSADRVIKDIVQIHPDYPTLTEIARVFFEENKDYDSAIELAVNESARTKNEDWFNTLISYIRSGHAKGTAPDYFNKAIYAAEGVRDEVFESLVRALWNHFKNEESYIQWIININSILAGMEIGNHAWHQLSSSFKETYSYLVNGRFTLKEVEHMVPGLVSNWLGLAHDSDILFASAAVLSWSELFQESISQDVINQAENLIYRTGKEYDALKNGIELYQSIVSWAEKNDTVIDSKYEWIIQELLDLKTRHIVVAGTKGNGKFTFSNSLIGQSILNADTTGVIAFKNYQDTAIQRITDAQVQDITHKDFYELTGRGQNRSEIIEFKLPSKFFRENGLSLLETPAFTDATPDRNPVFDYLHFADSLLFILNADTPFTAEERDILMQIREAAPDLPIHFVINSMDAYYGKDAAHRVAEETRSLINAYFPKAHVFGYSSEEESFKGFRELGEFISTSYSQGNFEKERTAKLLFYIRQTIKGLIEKRSQQEKRLEKTVQWDVDILSKLKGASHQLDDLEKVKAGRVEKSFASIKAKVRAEMEEKIPQLLKKSSDFINEDSDFSTIEEKLNDEMNERIESYIDRDILPRFYLSLQEWIKNAAGEFNESQTFLDEMREGFNSMYGEEKLALKCDFKVLDDWQRDSDRMTGGFHLDNMKILHRFSPQQFLLKSAGKLFGAISQNKTPVYNKYKQYIESEDYSEIAKKVTDKFLSQFDMFERSLNRDMRMFFKEPNKELLSVIEDTEKAISSNTKTLEALKQDPAAYYDPLTLFEVRLRSFEWIMIVDKEVQYIY